MKIKSFRSIEVHFSVLNNYPKTWRQSLYHQRLFLVVLNANETVILY